MKASFRADRFHENGNIKVAPKKFQNRETKATLVLTPLTCEVLPMSPYPLTAFMFLRNFSRERRLPLSSV